MKRLDVIYGLPEGDVSIIPAMDKRIEDVVGKESDSAGCGPGGRDMQFYFETKLDRAYASHALLASGLNVRVISEAEANDGRE